MNSKQIYILTAIACFGISGMASGAALGFAQIGQCLPAAPAGLSGFTFSGSTVTWDPPTLGGTAGCFVTSDPADITSTQPTIVSGQMGNIQNLTAGGGAVDQFITFPGTNLDFVLTGFGATTTNSTACDTVIGHSCIWAAGSPFDLTNTAGGVSIGVIMLGTIVDGGVISDWNALFTTQLLSSTALDVQNTILGAGSISDTYSAVLTVSPPASSSPEPGTLSMLLLGSVGLIGMGRKRFAKR